MVKIKVEKITKIYGNRPHDGLKLLDAGKSNKELRDSGHAVGCVDVSFDVEQGELLVVMGLSGSGKSTLIRCLNSLNLVTRGSIYVDGEDITKFGTQQLLDYRRKKISMVFQNFALFPYRTVTDNAAYGLEVQNVAPAERRKRAREALELVGLKGWEDAYPGQLSGGMQQRVGLARALAVQSDILLMDEAFSALDPLIRRDMQHELVQLQRRMKKTIVFITHDLNEALKLGDRIVMMKDGRVVQVGTPESILDNPATEYVERFTRNVDRSSVLTAKSALTLARVLAYPQDGPHVVMRKMNEENYTSIVVVERDLTYRGTISLDAVESAARRGDPDIAELIEKSPPITDDTPLTEVINTLAKWPYSLPVVNRNGECLGVVTRTGVINVLARPAPTFAANGQSTTQSTDAPIQPQLRATTFLDNGAVQT